MENFVGPSVGDSTVGGTPWSGNRAEQEGVEQNKRK